MTPFFSIIIPVYNVAPYLRECLDSVLAQTFADWEAICVDDGSTDDSGAILDEYAAKDSRFRVFHQSNAGVSAARNKALDVAQGEWIAFLDGDDLLRTGAFELMKDALNKHPGAEVIVPKMFWFAHGGSITWNRVEFEFFETDHSVPRRVLNAVSLTGAFSIFRRALGAIRFPLRRLGEDRIYMLECVCRANGALISDGFLAAYRQRPGSAAHSSWNVGRWKEELEYRILCLRLRNEVGKSVCIEQIDWIANFVTVRYPAFACTLSGEGRKECLDYWLQNVCFLCSFRGFALKRRIVMLICKVIPRRAVVYFLYRICFKVRQCVTLFQFPKQGVVGLTKLRRS